MFCPMITSSALGAGVIGLDAWNCRTSRQAGRGGEILLKGSGLEVLWRGTVLPRVVIELRVLDTIPWVAALGPSEWYGRNRVEASHALSAGFIWRERGLFCARRTEGPPGRRTPPALPSGA